MSWLRGLYYVEAWRLSALLWGVRGDSAHSLLTPCSPQHRISRIKERNQTRMNPYWRKWFTVLKSTRACIISQMDLKIIISLKGAAIKKFPILWLIVRLIRKVLKIQLKLCKLHFVDPRQRCTLKCEKFHHTILAFMRILRTVSCSAVSEMWMLCRSGKLTLATFYNIMSQ